MVALADIVAGEAKNIAYAQSGCAENVALQCNTIAVSAGELCDRSEPAGDQNGGGGGAGHVAIGAGAVGDIDGVDQIAEAGAARDQHGGIGGVGRGDLDGGDETPGLARLFETEGLACRRGVDADSGRRRMRAVDHLQP